MFHVEKFVHGITESLDQVIAQPATWTIETLTSKAAQKRYAIMIEVGQRLAEILVLIALATIASIDEYVETCQSRPQEPQPLEVDLVAAFASCGWGQLSVEPWEAALVERLLAV